MSVICPSPLLYISKEGKGKEYNSTKNMKPLRRQNSSLPNSHRYQQKKKRGKSKYLSIRMKRLRSDMEEISEEQTKIKEGQREVREKFETIELECERLRMETRLIIQQSKSTQIRLFLMFEILKARQNKLFDKASKLQDALRELIAKEKHRK